MQKILRLFTTEDELTDKEIEGEFKIVFHYFVLCKNALLKIAFFVANINRSRCLSFQRFRIS